MKNNDNGEKLKNTDNLIRCSTGLGNILGQPEDFDH